MPKKRGADEQASEDPVLENQNKAKCTKLTTPSDTTLQDLPKEVLRSILLETVVGEVKNLKLVKTSWKRKADNTMNRLKTVSPLWSSVVTDSSFREEAHRMLDETAPGKNRLEVLLEFPIAGSVHRVVAMGDELFMLCRPKHEEPFIQAYDRHNLNEVKYVIALQETLPVDMVACSVSNCLYVLCNASSHSRSVLRIKKDEEEDAFCISPWITNLSLWFSSMSLFVSVNGNLIILCHKNIPDPSVASIFSPNGLLQHEVVLSKDLLGYVGAFSAIENSDGNLVLATYCHDYEYVAELKEVDMGGRLVRQYRSSSIFGDGGMTVADRHGRIVIIGQDKECELLDSEFNLIIYTEPRDSHLHIQFGMHYNTERDEIVRLYEIATDKRTRALTIFRFTEE